MESRTSKMDAASSSRRRMAWSASAREWHGAFCSSHAPNSHPSSHRWKRGPKPSHRHYSSPIAIDSNERILHQSPQHDCALPQADKPAIIRPIPLGFIITLWRRNRYRRSLFGKRVEEVRIANNFHSMIGPSSARFRKPLHRRGRFLFRPINQQGAGYLILRILEFAGSSQPHHTLQLIQSGPTPNHLDNSTTPYSACQGHSSVYPTFFAFFSASARSSPLPSSKTRVTAEDGIESSPDAQ